MAVGRHRDGNYIGDVPALRRIRPHRMRMRVASPKAGVSQGWGIFWLTISVCLRPSRRASRLSARPWRRRQLPSGSVVIMIVFVRVIVVVFSILGLSPIEWFCDGRLIDAGGRCRTDVI